jgi:hypothetical protein
MSLRPSYRARVMIGLVLVWAGVAVSGFALLARYKSTPGQAEVGAPSRWPAHSRLEPAAGRPTLVLFAHPHCPCTHASVSELARLMARFSDRVAGHVVIVRPTGVEADWDDTELRRRAAAIEGVKVSVDEGGAEAAHFQAAVSGYTVLYDERGQLRFAGGITSARGHEGDSFGQRRVAAVLTGQTADSATAPVFGCNLGGMPRGHESHLDQEGS